MTPCTHSRPGSCEPCVRQIVDAAVRRAVPWLCRLLFGCDCQGCMS